MSLVYEDIPYSTPPNEIYGERNRGTLDLLLEIILGRVVHDENRRGAWDLRGDGGQLGGPNLQKCLPIVFCRSLAEVGDCSANVAGDQALLHGAPDCLGVVRRQPGQDEAVASCVGDPEPLL